MNQTHTGQTHAGMQCPVCKTGLVMTERQNIEIDYCPQCRGVWLDRGELDKILERSLSQAKPEPAPRPAKYSDDYASGQHRHRDEACR